MPRLSSKKHQFQSFWAGAALSPYEQLCIKSFIDHGHGFRLYTYDSTLKAPPGVEISDASELLNADEFFVYQDGFGAGSPAGFSNLFRYKLLLEKGGWWVDTDVICLSADIPLFNEFIAREDTDWVNNAVMFFCSRPPVDGSMFRKS